MSWSRRHTGVDDEQVHDQKNEDTLSSVLSESYLVPVSIVDGVRDAA